MIVTSTSFREKVVLKDDSLFCVVSCSYLCRLFKLYYVVYFSCTLFIFFHYHSSDFCRDCLQDDLIVSGDAFTSALSLNLVKLLFSVQTVLLLSFVAGAA